MIELGDRVVTLDKIDSIVKQDIVCTVISVSEQPIRGCDSHTKPGNWTMCDNKACLIFRMENKRTNYHLPRCWICKI